MGTSVSGGTTSVNQTTTPTPTAAETAMENIQLGQYQAFAPAQTTMFQNAFALGNQLLTGVSNQGGSQWQSLIGGVTPEQVQSQVNTQDRTLRGSLQQAGIYDSGTSASSRLRSAADLSNQNAQFNVGTLQNALNLALSGQAQVQAPAQGATSQLGSQLAGLRSINTQGNTNYSGYQTASPYSMVIGGISAAGQLASGIGGAMRCWVAAEIFGGWHAPKTCAVRYYISNISPVWFCKFYTKYGERIAKFIHNKPILKLMLRPLFECFAMIGKQGMKGLVA